MITSIIPICFRPASLLFDLRSTFSYVSAYFASGFNFVSEPVSIPIHVSTSVGDSLVTDWVYRSSVMPFSGFETLVDLLVLDIVNFDVFLGMGWLALHRVVLNCFNKTVALALAGVPRIAWKGALYSDPKKIISYI